jgi:hypothetical protein
MDYPRWLFTLEILLWDFPRKFYTNKEVIYPGEF